MELEAKKKAIAEILDGKVVDDSSRVEICIKGSLIGFPATLESFKSGFPFNVTYFIETETEAERKKMGIVEPFKISISPRYTKGLLSFITRIFLFESKGDAVGDKKFESVYISSHNDYQLAERLIRYPGVIDEIKAIHKMSHFNELVLRAKYGVYLSQAKSFNQLDVDVARETFRSLSNLGQILFDAF